MNRIEKTGGGLDGWGPGTQGSNEHGEG